MGQIRRQLRRCLFLTWSCTRAACEGSASPKGEKSDGKKSPSAHEMAEESREGTGETRRTSASFPNGCGVLSKRHRVIAVSLVSWKGDGCGVPSAEAAPPHTLRTARVKVSVAPESQPGT